MEQLDRPALIEILTGPKNALVKQYQKFFEYDGVTLEFSEDALDAVADLAILRGTGARGLRAILEEVLLNTMYELPSLTDIGECMITADVVRDELMGEMGRRVTQNVVKLIRDEVARSRLDRK